MSLSFLTVTAVSSLLGFLSGLGVGGGSLLLLWLTLVAGVEPSTARLINLLFFLPAAAVSCLIHSRQGTLCLKQIWPAALSGCIGAVLGSITAKTLPVGALKKCFGVLLLATGLRELFHKPQKQAS